MAAFSSERSKERIGLALIALVVLWIAVGLEVALLAAVLIVGLELYLGRDEGDSGEADPPSAPMPYTPMPPPPPARRPRPPDAAGAPLRALAGHALQALPGEHSSDSFSGLLSNSEQSCGPSSILLAAASNPANAGLASRRSARWASTGRRRGVAAARRLGYRATHDG